MTDRTTHARDGIGASAANHDGDGAIAASDDGPRTAALYWYVLAAYLVAVALGAAAFVALVAATNKLTLVAVGAVAIVTVLAVAGLATFPALYKDAAYLDGAADWDPNAWLYVAGGALTPVLGYVAGGHLVGPRLNLALSTLSWVGSVTGMCLLYLYRRHRFVGTP